MDNSVSIVLSAYNRAQQLEKTLDSIQMQRYPGPIEVIVVEDGQDGQTEWIARRHQAKYIRKVRPNLPVFQNPSRVHNIGIKAAQNEIVILQGAEVRYTSPTDVANLVAPVIDDPITAATACVQSLNKNGDMEEWYVHPSEGRRAGWIVNFCLALKRERLLRISGFEESFIGYGFEDDYFMHCLRLSGVRFEYARNVVVQHQWHDRSQYDLGIAEDYSAGHRRLLQLKNDIEQGRRKPIANPDKEWGVL